MFDKSQSGKQVKCPKCGKMGELRFYAHQKYHMIVHKKDTVVVGGFGFNNILESCYIHKDPKDDPDLKKVQMKKLKSNEPKLEKAKIRRSFFIGSIYGDTSIWSSKKGVRLMISHSDKQRQYLEFKKVMLKPWIKERMTWKRKETSKGTSTIFRVTTEPSEDFRFLYDYKKNGFQQEYFDEWNEWSLLALFIDDGSMQMVRTSKNVLRRYAQIPMVSKSEEAVDRMIKMLAVKFQLFANKKAKGKGFILTFDPDNSTKIARILGKMIPTDDVVYKFGGRYKSANLIEEWNKNVNN